MLYTQLVAKKSGVPVHWVPSQCRRKSFVLKWHLYTGKSQCCKSQCSATLLSLKRWKNNVGHTYPRNIMTSMNYFYKRFAHNLPIFLTGKIWLNIGICQTLWFSILKILPLVWIFCRQEQSYCFDAHTVCLRSKDIASRNCIPPYLLLSKSNSVSVKKIHHWFFCSWIPYIRLWNNRPSENNK
jgi:hypothetical protein